MEKYNIFISAFFLLDFYSDNSPHKCTYILNIARLCRKAKQKKSSTKILKVLKYKPHP